jgi:hypothetical protein
MKRTILTLDNDLLKRERAATQDKTPAARVNDVLGHAMVIRSRHRGLSGEVGF